VSEIPSGSKDLNYRNLLWEVLDASTELEKVHQDPEENMMRARYGLPDRDAVYAAGEGERA